MEAIAIFAALFGVIALVWWVSPTQQIKRQLRGALTFKIGELGEQARGRIIGTARAYVEQLEGPLSGRPCVYYIAKVEQRRSTGRSSYWRTIVTETRGVRFVVEDETGRAIVDPISARMALDFDARTSSGMFDDPTEAERAFLARHGLRGEGVLFNKRLRYREAVIAVGETIAVLGEGTREPDPNESPADYRGDQPTLLRLTSSPRFPLVISDDPSTTRA
jgi:hypothetical protein